MGKLIRCTSLLIWLLIASCEGKREILPSYLTIDTIDFEYSNIGIVGNGGTNITDAWIYVNDNLLGVFELPTTVAIQSKGEQRISVSGGIKLNGISSTREVYPYYERWTENVLLTPMDTVVITPKVSYYAETGISFKEEFQDVILGLDTNNLSDVALERAYIEDGPFYLGKYVGKVVTTNSTPGFKAVVKELFMVPKDVRLPIYLELDYKCNQEFTIGYIVRTPANGSVESRLINLRSTVDSSGILQWNHIYIDLTDAFSGQPDATGFGISFTAYHNTGETEGYIFLDNIKVVNQGQ